MDHSKFAVQHDRDAGNGPPSALQRNRTVHRRRTALGRAATHRRIGSPGHVYSSAAASVALAAPAPSARCSSSAKLFVFLPVGSAAVLAASAAQYVGLLVDVESTPSARESSKPSAHAEPQSDPNGLNGDARPAAAPSTSSASSASSACLAPATSSAFVPGFALEPGVPGERLQQHLALLEHAAKPGEGKLAAQSPKAEFKLLPSSVAESATVTSNAAAFSAALAAAYTAANLLLAAVVNRNASPAASPIVLRTQHAEPRGIRNARKRFLNTKERNKPFFCSS